MPGQNITHRTTSPVPGSVLSWFEICQCLKTFLTLVLLLVVAPPVLSGLAQHNLAEDPCDAYGDCLSSTIVFIRSNTDHTLYLGDSFAIPISVSIGASTR